MLFDNLPEQSPPTSYWTDLHAKDQCERCRGTGRRRYSFYGGGYHAERGTKNCNECGGAGWKIRWLGPAT